MRIAFEAATDQIPEYETWSPEVQTAFLNAHAESMLATLQGEGFYARLTDNGFGVWINDKGEIENNPMAAIEISVGSLSSEARHRIPDSEYALYEAITGLIGKHRQQAGQAWMRPVVNKAQAETTFWRLDTDLTVDQINAIARKVEKHGYVSPTKAGIIIGRYDPDTILDVNDQIAALGVKLKKGKIDKVEHDAQVKQLRSTRKANHETFRDVVYDAVADVLGDGIVNTDALRGASHRGNYQAGLESYTAAIDSGGRPDLLGRLDRALADSSAEINDAFIRNPEGAARGYGSRAAEPVKPYYWEARGYFPHRRPNEFIPGSMNPTALAAAGDTVGVPKPTRAFERRRNELALYGAGLVNMDARVLVNTVRGRVKYQKTLEGREYLYDHGLTIVAGAQIPKGEFYYVRNPETLPTKIPEDVKAILAHPDTFMKGDQAKLDIWRNEWIREADPSDPDGGMPIEWAGDLSNVRLVPKGNVDTLLGDAFYSAPRGGVASFAALLNSAARGSVIYLPYGGTRYVIRNTVQNALLLTFTKPSAWKNVATATHRAFKDKEFWDAAVVETGGFPAGAGLPDRSVRGTSKIQRAEKRVTGASRALSSALSNIADEPFRVASWMRYAEEYGFKGKARQKELLNSQEPGIVAVRDQIGQMVRDDMLDFNTLSPAMQEGAARFLFILPFQAAAAKWPIMFAREQTTKAALLGLIAAQHEREGSFWGEVQTAGGRVVNLGWLSPAMPLQENLGLVAETVRAASEGRLDLNALGSLLSPTWRDTVRALSRGGVPFEQLAKTWVPGYASTKEVLAYTRGQQDIHELVDKYLGTKPRRWEKSTAGKAAKWAEESAELWGAVPKELVGSKALLTEYESLSEGKTEHQKTAMQAEMFFDEHPERKSDKAQWLERVKTTPTEDLDDTWQAYFEKQLGWTDVKAIDSRVEVWEDLKEYLEANPDSEEKREKWRTDIARSDDDRLSGWRGWLEEWKEKEAA